MAIAIALVLGVTTTFGAAARAKDDPALFSVGVGAFDVIEGDDDAVDFRLEYRHGGTLWLVKPWVGIEATSDGGLYGAAGLLADFHLGERVVLTPSLGVGGFAEGDGKDLGHALEFRSQIEAAYRFDDQSRLGLAFSHISNASLGDRNPGVEVLTVYYSLPVSRIFGH
jgi:hypothetical protein